MFRRILVPLDGSPLGEHALPYALSIARKANAAVHVALVHVPDAYGDYAHTEDMDADVKAHEQKYLDTLSRKLPHSFKGTIQVHFLEGIVPETLAEEVAERDIDLVVMNAHGWGYLSRAITGSVSDYLMRHLTIPMLLMHSQAESTELGRDIPFCRTLICLDGSELAETILPPAQLLGQLWKGEYQLLRVISPPSHLLAGYGDEAQPCQHGASDKAKADADAYLETVAQRMRDQSAVVHVRLATDRNVAATILREADALQCDLIAISTHGRGGLSRLLLGSVADKIVRGAHRPVLVYRATGGRDA